MTDVAIPNDVEDQTQLALHSVPAQRACNHCGEPFSPRQHSGGSPQQFCNTDCRLAFHRERQRFQRSGSYAGPTTLPATEQPAPTEQASEADEPDDSFVLMGQQDFIKVAWDRHGNLLLCQDRLYEGDHELRILRDYFPQFVHALDVLREVIVDAIQKDRAL
jgi:hypothetical protein